MKLHEHIAEGRAAVDRGRVQTADAAAVDS